MSHETIERIFRQVFCLRIHRNTLDIVWHAGEPFVLSPDWYEGAFAIVDRLTPPHVRVAHRFQTNGMLLNVAWCRFLKNKVDNVKVRVSIDGPQEIHDTRRRMRNGAGTFAKVMAGIQRLRALNIDFGITSVLTADSLKAPEALFNFYESIGVKDIAFNFEEIEGINRATSLSQPGSLECYRRFLRVWCALSAKRGKDWNIREINDAYCYLLGIVQVDNAQAIPGRILSFDHRGGMSTFSPELLTMQHSSYGDFILGNIYESTISAILNEDKARALNRDITDGVALCRSSCNHFRYCGGGAPSNKLFENGSFVSAETIHCRFRVKATIDALLEEMRSAIDGVAERTSVR
jgi:uncharacterized protein